MKTPTFQVRQGKTSGRYIEEANVIDEESISFTFGRGGNEMSDIFIGSYSWGCEGDGHYLGTTLPPGKYKIISIEDTQ